MFQYNNVFYTRFVHFSLMSVFLFLIYSQLGSVKDENKKFQVFKINMNIPPYNFIKDDTFSFSSNLDITLNMLGKNKCFTIKKTCKN